MRVWRGGKVKTWMFKVSQVVDSWLPLDHTNHMWRSLVAFFFFSPIFKAGIRFSPFFIFFHPFRSVPSFFSDCRSFCIVQVIFLKYVSRLRKAQELVLEACAASPGRIPLRRRWAGKFKKMQLCDEMITLCPVMTSQRAATKFPTVSSSYSYQIVCKCKCKLLSSVVIV